MRRQLQILYMIAFLLTGTMESVAQPLQTLEASQLIARANQSLLQGDFASAQHAVDEVISRARVWRSERAEAFRILGVLLAFQDKEAEARQAFLRYLRLDPDAHLDPSLVPPEIVTLLEDVRSKHQEEIDSLRPKPRTKRYALLNLLPAAGQWQNGASEKAWLIGGGIALLLASNLGSYVWLTQNCDEQLLTCGSSSVDRTETALNLKTLNLVSGVGLAGLYMYSLIDGYLGYRELEDNEEQRRRSNDMSLRVSATPDSATFSLSIQY